MPVPLMAAGGVTPKEEMEQAQLLATRQARRLYVGGLSPLGSPILTGPGLEEALSEALFKAVADRPEEPGDVSDPWSKAGWKPIMSIYISPQGGFGFVEFRSVEIAAATLGLDGE